MFGLLEAAPVVGLSELVDGAHAAPLALTLSSFAMLIAITRDYHAASTELSTANDELRRQIAERSRDLADALAGTLRAESESRELSTGETIDGRYEVIRLLGRGGMGAVYEVKRASDGARFALKSMTRYADSQAAARFAHEAELVASVHHENLVDIIDVGFSRSGFMFLVMELVTGGSLETMRDRFGDVAWAKRTLGQIAGGLEALHARGIVHRDLKPANVLWSDERAKIADFGISRRDDTSDAEAGADTVLARKLTHTGALIGTPMYMAPELAMPGAVAKPASDVFAFGVLAYELLTGRYPFAAPPIAAAMVGVTTLASTPTRVSNPLVDAAIGELVDACFCEARPKSARRPRDSQRCLLRRVSGGEVG